MGEYKKIPKDRWEPSFILWINRVRQNISRTSKTSLFLCGYCLFFYHNWHFDEGIEGCGCPLKGKVCGTKKSLYIKWRNETRKQYPRWELVLRWSRQILQAIIDDGRKHNYIGEKEENMIREVM
jgi:hypothetical protein